MFNDKSIITPIEDDNTIQMAIYNFTTIKDIKKND